MWPPHIFSQPTRLQAQTEIERLTLDVSQAQSKCVQARSFVSEQRR
jgi:hypothetical protein